MSISVQALLKAATSAMSPRQMAASGSSGRFTRFDKSRSSARVGHCCCASSAHSAVPTKPDAPVTSVFLVDELMIKIPIQRIEVQTMLAYSLACLMEKAPAMCIEEAHRRTHKHADMGPALSRGMAAGMLNSHCGHIG